VVRPALAAALLILMGAPAVAQEPRDGFPPIFRSGVQLVPLNVTVTDLQRHFVRGLTAEDFTVLEDGVAQEVQFFDAADVPIDLILLVDTSSSMGHNMPVVHEAALGFLSTLRAQDRGAVVAFADRVDVVQELTSDRSSLEGAVRRMTARGATALHDAIYISLKLFGHAAQREGEIRRQAIAVLTDGEDTSSLLAFDEVVGLARQSGVTIYPITLVADPAAERLELEGLRRTATQMRSQYLLRQLARETGAQAFLSVRLPGLKDVYSSIAEELANQYSIAYAPTDTTPDGRLRQIVVQVASRPELRLRTRTGYTVEPASGRAELGRPGRALRSHAN